MSRATKFTLLICVFVCANASWERASAAQAPIAESYDAIYVGESKVGHMHLWIEPVKDGQGRDLRRVRIDYEMTFSRGNDLSKTELQYGTIETLEGEVLRLDTLTKSSEQAIKSAQGAIRTHGDVRDGKMTLNLDVGGRSVQKEIPWGAEVRGPYGAELSLSRVPMKPGDTRDVKTYIPDLNKVCLTKLAAKEFEEIPLGPQAVKTRLLRIEQTVTEEDGTPLQPSPMPDTTLWVSESGQIMKSFTNAFGGMYTYRTTREGALAKSKAPFQLLGASIIKTPQPIANPETTRAIAYRLKGNNVAKLFPNDQRQTLQPEGEGVARLDVATDGIETAEPGPETVDSAYSRPNPLIDSEDALVRQHARRAIGNARDPWQRAVAIQEWVYKNMKSKNFEIAFAPAAQVAKNLSGDCTEHAVLTAAMCRAAGIPTRCVVGLVYASPQGGYGFHMWNEVYVNRRWVAIDAAFGQSAVDATHIKMLDTSLDGVSPFETFMPVLQVFGNLQIEPLDVRR